MLRYIPLLALAACATPQVASVHPTYEPFTKVLEREPIGELYTIEQCQSMKRIDDIDGEWKTPTEFLADGGGDCEDFAICVYYALRSKGVSANKVFIIATNDHVVTQHGNKIYDVDTQFNADMWLRTEKPIGKFNEHYALAFKR
jgi:predicted transglutaminase-like cysteine proteinase